jgi:hypothetical protein
MILVLTSYFATTSWVLNLQASKFCSADWQEVAVLGPMEWQFMLVAVLLLVIIFLN